jgi:hypothetical protein
VFIRFFSNTLVDDDAVAEKDWLFSHNSPWVIVEEKWKKTSAYRVEKITSLAGPNVLEIINDWPLYKHSYGQRLVN